WMPVDDLSAEGELAGDRADARLDDAVECSVVDQLDLVDARHACRRAVDVEQEVPDRLGGRVDHDRVLEDQGRRAPSGIQDRTSYVTQPAGACRRRRWQAARVLRDKRPGRRYHAHRERRAARGRSAAREDRMANRYRVISGDGHIEISPEM